MPGIPTDGGDYAWQLSHERHRFNEGAVARASCQQLANVNSLLELAA